MVELENIGELVQAIKLFLSKHSKQTDLFAVSELGDSQKSQPFAAWKNAAMVPSFRSCVQL
jgi:hypothetical protein